MQSKLIFLAHILELELIDIRHNHHIIKKKRKYAPLTKVYFPKSKKHFICVPQQHLMNPVAIT